MAVLKYVSLSVEGLKLTFVGSLSKFFFAPINK